MRFRRFLHFLLFALVCLLVWQIVETWQRPLEDQRPAAQQNPIEEQTLPSPQAAPPQLGKRFAGIIADKDLFVPSRGRVQVEEQPVATIPPPSHLKLVGVVLTNEKEEALFADSTQGGKVIRIRKGESLGSYKLSKVAPLLATLTMGQDGTDEVNLPLLVLDSNTAGQAPMLIPPPRADQQVRGNIAGRLASVPGDPGGMNPQDAAQSESHAIRQNIQQLQRRLRQLRRQAARGNVEEGFEESGGQEESVEEEE